MAFFDPNKYENNTYTHPFSAKSAKSRGRLKSISPDKNRSEFLRDVHRITYSQPFRRLKHKTQVFYIPRNDHICTRLEHSLLVSSASKCIARALHLNEDLTEAIALGHDLGHAPFGHHGEKILDKIVKKHNPNASFQHEVNSLRVIDKLAELDREPQIGLCLTFEVRDGIVSHCGEDFTQRQLIPFNGSKDLDIIKKRSDAGLPSTLEGCIVRLVDKVAYAGRDLEDGLLHAGLIDESKIPHDIKSKLGRNNGEIVGNLVSDIIACSPLDKNYIEISEDKFKALNDLIKFNYENIYYKPEVQKYKTQVEIVINHLFEFFLDILNRTDRFKKENGFPEIKALNVFRNMINKAGYSDDTKNEQIVIDFISGCTDNYLLQLLEEIFIPLPIA